MTSVHSTIKLRVKCKVRHKGFLLLITQCAIHERCSKGYRARVLIEWKQLGSVTGVAPTGQATTLVPIKVEAQAT